MKRLFLVFCLLFPSAANAASPEDAYFAARDAASEKLGALPDVGASGPYEKAEKDLQQMMVPLVGPVVVKGFGSSGKLNLGSIAKGDEGFGTLDGLLFSTPDDKGNLIATSMPILQHWFAEHKNWREADQQNLPQTIELALKSDEFYNQAVQTDAAIIRFAELPIVQNTASGQVYAMLFGRTQDDTVSLAPDEIIVSLLTGQRLLIAIVPARAKFPAVPACFKAYTAADKKTQAATDAYIDSDRKNEALAAKALKLRTDAEAARETCLSAKVKTQKGFPDAVAQAQSLLGAMATAAK